MTDVEPVRDQGPPPRDTRSSDVLIISAGRHNRRLASNLKRFLKKFHRLKTPTDLVLRPLRVACETTPYRDTLSQRRKDEQNKETLHRLSRRADASHRVLFLAHDTDCVNQEIEHLLGTGRGGDILLGCTAASTNDSTLEQSLPSAAVKAGIHRSRLWYDFREFRNSKARDSASIVKNFEEQRTRLAADLNDKSAGDLRPLWFREQGKKAQRRNRIIIGCVSILILALSVMRWRMYENEQDRQRAQIDRLVHADSRAVVDVLANMDLTEDVMRSRVRVRLRDAQSDGEDRRLRLALLKQEAEHLRPLWNHLLKVDPPEFVVLGDQLAAFAPQIAEDLWTVALEPSTPGSQRRRALCALASYDPKSQHWNEVADDAARLLAGSNPMLRRTWCSICSPIQSVLLEPLENVYLDENEDAVLRLGATECLMVLTARNPLTLARLISRATPEQAALLFPLVSADRERVIPELVKIVRSGESDGSSEVARIERGKVRAGAASALMRLDKFQAALPVLQWSSDPEAQTQFVFGHQALGVTAEHLWSELQNAQDPQIAYGLLSALGEHAPSELSSAVREKVIAKLIELYREDQRSAIHGIVGWLLRTWGHGKFVNELDQRERPYDPTGNRDWFVQKIGPLWITFIVFNKDTFQIGALQGEAWSVLGETQHKVTINRRFAIADRPMTIGQYESIHFTVVADSPSSNGELDALRIKRHYDGICQLQGVTRQHASTGVSWQDSVKVCNWMTGKVGLDGQQCYRTGDFEPDTEKLGYRLPSEAEWEYACRCDAVTPFSFGSDPEVLSNYGWNQSNSGGHPHPPALLRPNPRGLFDMHGNVLTWCDASPPAPTSRDVFNTAKRIQHREKPARGGCWGSPWNGQGRAASRLWHKHNDNSAWIGLRIACTVPER